MDAWSVRREFQKFEFDMAYGLHPELFSIKIHHGGEFYINNYHKVYERGKVNYVDLLDIERFCIFELNDIIKKLGYQEESHFYYRFLIPGSDLDFGLRALANDLDVSNLMKFVPENRFISVYIEHEKTHLEQVQAIETLFPDWQDLQDDFAVNENKQENRVGNEEDGEIIVDEDNEMEEIEVDMNNFKFNIYDQNDKGKEKEVVDGYSSLEEENFSDDSFGTSSEEEEIETMRKKALRKLRKKHEASKEKCAFYVGQEFGNNEEVKSLIRRHAVETRREIGFYRNDQGTVRAVCRGKIPHIEDVSNEIPSQGPIQEGDPSQKGCPTKKCRKCKKDGQSKKAGRSNKCASSKKDGGRKTVENPYKCPWVLHVSKLTWEETWTVKTYNPSTTKFQVIGKCHGILTPTISKKLEVIKKEASKLTVKWNGGSKFQVTGYMGEQCVVDVAARTCSCRRWELTGIPCKHAVASNWNMSLNGLDVEIPEKWVDACYWLKTWKAIYSHKVEPINGKSMWPRSTCPIKLKEPKHHKPIGRPRKKRKKDATEKEDEMVKGGKLSKKLKTTTCGTCGNRGHNKRSCTGQGGASSTAPK